MTLLVGIRCTDGVVVAADSAVTFGMAQGPHTISDKGCKIRILHDKLIVAGTGQVGLGQRFEAVLTQLWPQIQAGNSPVHLSTFICANSLQNFGSTGVQKGQYGALVAFPVEDSPELCEFAVADFQPEMRTDRLWYSSMGSGQLLADPYLRLMRHVFWQNGPPTLQGGKFAAMWVMRQAIRAAPGGIADPIDMAVLERTDQGPRARMLSEEELKEHEESVESATEHFRSFEEKLMGSSDAKTQALPKLEG